MVLLSSNRLKLRRKMTRGSKSAKLAINIINNPRWFLATTSTGTNMLVIVASVVASVWFEHLYGEDGELLTITIISPILLLFGEIIPRTIFHRKATELAPKIAYPLLIASRIISPVTWFVYLAGRLFYPNVESEHSGRHHLVSREELELMLKVSGEQSDVKGSEKKMIHRVFHLTKSNVDDVMVPLVNLAAIPKTATVGEAATKMSQTGYSRLPVYADRIDNLIGMIHAFDLLDNPDSKSPIAPLIREILFVPELKRADDLLVTLQKTRNSIAVVVDEYGGAVGIVTIEDILEEVVGEIRDEYDRELKPIVKLGTNKYVMNSRTEIQAVNEYLGLNLPREDYDTIGGFLLKGMGRIPASGESFSYQNIRFVIRKAGKRAIHEILIELPDIQKETTETIN